MEKEKCQGCDLYKNGHCTKWSKNCSAQPSTIKWFTDDPIEKLEFTSVDRVCRKSSIFGNYYIAITQSDIDRLKNGEVGYILDEYGTFICLVEEKK